MGFSTLKFRRFKQNQLKKKRTDNFHRVYRIVSKVCMVNHDINSLFDLFGFLVDVG